MGHTIPDDVPWRSNLQIIIWATPCKNVSSGICRQRRPRSDCADAQSDQGHHCPNKFIRYSKMYQWKPKARMMPSAGIVIWIYTCCAYSKAFWFTWCGLYGVPLRNIFQNDCVIFFQVAIFQWSDGVPWRKCPQMTRLILYFCEAISNDGVHMKQQSSNDHNGVLSRSRLQMIRCCLAEEHFSKLMTICGPILRTHFQMIRWYSYEEQSSNGCTRNVFLGVCGQ